MKLPSSPLPHGQHRQQQVRLLLLALLPLLFGSPSCLACWSSSRPSEKCGSSGSEVAAAASAAAAHSAIECNPFERPALNCSGAGAACHGYKCVCASTGHVYVAGRGCRDVDECRELPQPCKGPGVSCMNVNGGYQCICDAEGHQYHPFKGCGQHNSCHFPFKYKGTYYHHCIRSQHHRLWCSRTEDYDKDRQFINCAAEFISLHCHFPFKYKGVEYKSCIGNGNEKWCATTYNYDLDGRWDICY